MAGVYYPDKTRVGWWKNGYPEFFAKVLNSPNWIGIEVVIAGETLDLHITRSCGVPKGAEHEGRLSGAELCHLQSVRMRVEIAVRRFLSIMHDEIGCHQLSDPSVNYSCSDFLNSLSRWQCGEPGFELR